MNFVIESKRSKERVYINIFIFVEKYIFIYSLIERERERIFVKGRGREVEREKEQWPNNTGLSLSSAIFQISIQFNFYHTFELGRFAEVNK